MGILGIATGGTAVLIAGAIVIVNLTKPQEDLAQRLSNDYQSSGLTLDEIRALVGDNPNLTEAQLRELLDQYKRIIAAYPNLVKQYGAWGVFNEFIALSAYNAAQGGDYPNKVPVRHVSDVKDGMVEAQAQLGATEDGKIGWPLQPSTQAAYESTDPSGQAWDVKKGYPYDPYGKPYDPVGTVDKLEKKDFARREKVIFDDSDLSQQQIDETYKELKNRGLDKDVVWWPTQPGTGP